MYIAYVKTADRPIWVKNASDARAVVVPRSRWATPTSYARPARFYITRCEGYDVKDIVGITKYV